MIVTRCPDLDSHALISRIILITLIVGLLLAIDTHTSHACVCAGTPSPEDEFLRSSRVFSGTVVETFVLDIPEGYEYLALGNPVIIHKMRVTNVWKGPLNETVYAFAAGVRTSCERTLDEGPEYIIYGGVSQCGRIAFIPNSKEDLAFLGAGLAPQVGTSQPEPVVIRQVQAVHDRITRMRLIVAAGTLATIAAVVVLVLGARSFLRRKRAPTIA